MQVVLLGAPTNYFDLLGPDAPTVTVTEVILPGCGFVHLFTTRRGVLQQTLTDVQAVMARDGMIWVSWPKKASKVPSEVTEDAIREVCLPMGLVDVKVCAVSEVWSGLKLVVRKELR